MCVVYLHGTRGRIFSQDKGRFWRVGNRKYASDHPYVALDGYEDTTMEGRVREVAHKSVE